MTLLLLFWEFFKIGLFTFGGAYGSIPLILDTVTRTGWATEEEFSHFLAISESTPGPIMVNMATYVGVTEAGLLGGAVATLGVVLPSFFSILLIASLLRHITEHPLFRGATAAVIPAVIGIILTTGAFLFFDAVTISSAEGAGVSLASLAVTLVLLAALFLWRRVRQKPMSPILLIALSALLGIIFF